MLKKDSFLKLSIFINVFMVFFGNYITNLYYFQIASCICIIFYYVLARKKISINKTSFLWIVFIIACVISLINSKSIVSSLEIISLITMAVIIKILYENVDIDWKDKCINIMYFFSLIHLVFTILQLILPTFIQSINSLILSPTNQAMNINLLNRGGYAGITGQTSLNAFYISIFILITVCRILLKKGNIIINFTLLFLGILGLFLTAKRGFLLFVISIMAIIYLYISFKDKKHTIINITILLMSILLINIVITKIPEAKAVFDKIEVLEDYGDLSNGRNFLWSGSMDLFKKSKIFGVGIGTVSTYLGDYTHNVYIQLLAETGIIGCISYAIALIGSLYITLKQLRNKKYLKSKNYYYSSISLCLQLLFILYSFTGNPLYGQIFLVPYFIGASMNSRTLKEENE